MAVDKIYHIQRELNKDRYEQKRNSIRCVSDKKDVKRFKDATMMQIIGNEIEKLPTTLSQLSQLKYVEFEWFNYIINEPNIIYNKTLSLFKSLFNKKQLYCNFNQYPEKVLFLFPNCTMYWT